MAILKDPQTIEEFVNSINQCKWTITKQKIQQKWRDGWRDSNRIGDPFTKEYRGLYSEYNNVMDAYNAGRNITRVNEASPLVRFVEKDIEFHTDMVTYPCQSQEIIKDMLGQGMDTEDVRKYTPGMTVAQLKELKTGFENQVDISKYADPKYTAEQMMEIRIGLINKLDISTYADINLTAEQMREVRLGLTDGLDVSKYTNEKYPARLMQAIREGLKNNVDITKYITPQTSYHKAQRICKKMMKNPQWHPLFYTASSKVREETDKVAIEAADQMTDKQTSDNVKQVITNNKQDLDDNISQIQNQIGQIKQQLNVLKENLSSNSKLSYIIGDEIDAIITLYDMAGRKIQEYQNRDVELSKLSDFVTSQEKIEKLNSIVNTTLTMASDMPDLPGQTEDYLQTFAVSLNQEIEKIDQWVHDEVSSQINAEIQMLKQNITFNGLVNEADKDQQIDRAYDKISENSDEKTQLIDTLIENLQNYQILSDEFNQSMLAMPFYRKNLLKGYEGQVKTIINEQQLFSKTELINAVEKEIKSRYEKTRTMPSSPENQKNLAVLQKLMKDPQKTLEPFINKQSNQKAQMH